MMSKNKLQKSLGWQIVNMFKREKKNSQIYTTVDLDEKQLWQTLTNDNHKIAGI